MHRASSSRRPSGRGTIALDRAQANYLLNVLRLKAGDSVLVFNGRDGEWRARSSVEGRKAADLVCVDADPASDRRRPTSIYAFAPLKHARLDYMVQKAVEMGAGVLQPIRTRRTQSTRVNLDRMRANGIEAAEQCGILTLPEIREERISPIISMTWRASAWSFSATKRHPFRTLLTALKDGANAWEPRARMRRYRRPRRGIYRRGESTCCRPREMCSRIVGTPNPPRRHRRRRRPCRGADAFYGDWN